MKKKATRARREDVARARCVFCLLRAIRGIKDVEVASKAGVSAHTVRNLRTPLAQGGTMFPHLNTIIRIGKAYGLELQFIERSTGERPDVTARPRIHSTYRPGMALN